MVHHVSVGTNDLERAKAFYDLLMSLVGFRLLKASETAVHYGASDIVFSVQTPINGRPATPGNGVHIAFQAPDRETVRRFYQTALAHGGTTRERLEYVKIIMLTITAHSSEISMVTRLKR
jgi:catechol 2,3-dioxygenase-like lactoylglutathione lyase family enzyme